MAKTEENLKRNATEKVTLVSIIDKNWEQIVAATDEHLMTTDDGILEFVSLNARIRGYMAKWWFHRNRGFGGLTLLCSIILFILLF